MTSVRSVVNVEKKNDAGSSGCERAPEQAGGAWRADQRTYTETAGGLARDGDVVRVETRDPNPISVIGLVQKPGQYEMPVGQPVHVLDAIAMAGERSNPWADKIYITRHVTSENEPIVIETSVVNAQHSDESNIRLSPGDVVSVEQTPQTVIHNVFSTIFRFSIVAGQSIPLF